MTWHKLGRDHYESAGGRYNLFLTYRAEWVIVDWDAGRRYHFASREAAEKFCEDRSRQPER
jgi:hypothetical protein